VASLVAELLPEKIMVMRTFRTISFWSQAQPGNQENFRMHRPDKTQAKACGYQDWWPIFAFADS
jgi:hypothetical protein